MDSISNHEEEIQEITSDNEPENHQRPTLVRTETEKEGICTEENSTSAGTERELDGKEKNTTEKGIKEILYEWRSKIRRCCGIICGYNDPQVPRVRVYQVWPGKNVSISFFSFPFP